ncbi:MAG TPA: MFS transporter [Anaerovoracaceae bacterium]|nr:MFS transporter [Anaerovoracaceae bacterium]
MALNRDSKTMGTFMLKFVVLAVGVQDVSSGAAAAAIAPMIAEFPSVSPTNIQLMVTLPNLMVVFMAPIFAALSTKIDIRKLVIFALICFLAGGASPVFFDTFPPIMIGRIILGIGSGITIPAAISLIPMFWDGHEKDTMMGWHMTMGCIGGIAMQTLGGYLTLVDWHYCFLAYLFPVWVLILIILKLPSTPKEYMNAKNAQNEEIKKAPFLKRLNLKSWALVIIYFVVTVFICTMPMNISIILEGEQIGNAANAGIALSLFTAGALVGGLVFGFVKGLAGGYAMALALIINGLGYAILAFGAFSIPVVYFCTLLSGFGMGMLIPSYYTRVSEIAPKIFATVSISFVVAAQGLGNFISPQILAGVNAMFRQDVGRFPIIAGAVVLIAAGVIVAVTFALSGGNNKRNKELNIA